jgi:penicillin-binding protein 2
MVAESADVVRVPLDPQNWITITNAMVGVVAPGGTASSAHIEGVDFAGKTGTAQVVSHAFREGKQKLGSEYNDNVWFVGVSPRRNPEIVVAVLLEGGQSSPLAGRTAAQVVRAFVEKQRRIRKNPSLFSDKNTPDAVPMAALWNSPTPSQDAQQSTDSLHGGTVLVKMGKPSVLKRAVTDPAILKPKQAALGIPSADGN